MLPNDFLHPDHVVPSPELVAAFVKLADHGIPLTRMKPNAVFCQIFIFRFRVSDAGIQIQDMLGAGNLFQRGIESVS